jgi:hypothetical protein
LTYVLTLRYIPETKGKSLEEIQAELRGESPLAHDSDEENQRWAGAAASAAATSAAGGRKSRADSEDDFGGNDNDNGDDDGLATAVGTAVGGMARSLYESQRSSSGSGDNGTNHGALDMASVDDYLGTGSGGGSRERSDSD